MLAVPVSKSAPSYAGVSLPYFKRIRLRAGLAGDGAPIILAFIS